MTEQEKGLLEAGKILDRLGIPFFLILGTCLGAIREGRVLPWDRDADLGCLVEDLAPRAIEVMKAAQAAGFEASLRNRPAQGWRAVVLRRPGCHIDIAGFFRRDDKRFSPSSLEDYCLVYPAAMLENTAEVQMLGRAWRTPAPAEEYLRLHYGPTWRTPDRAWRPRNGGARIYGYWGGNDEKSSHNRHFRPAPHRAPGLSKGRQRGRRAADRRRHLR